MILIVRGYYYFYAIFVQRNICFSFVLCMAAAGIFNFFCIELNQLGVIVIRMQFLIK